ncbi:Alpha/Beta hydrolase protein, partial [Suillus occidentalis]
GPGGGTNPKDREFLNPAKYEIVLFDQRGAGKSTSSAELENNITWALVRDIEVLRQGLDVTKWHVCGGSWGSTLSLAYAQVYTSRVKSLVLRELRFFYQDGASRLYGEEHLALIAEAERHDMMKAYHSRLNSLDTNISQAAAKAWAKWVMATSRLIVSTGAATQADIADFA